MVLKPPPDIQNKIRDAFKAWLELDANNTFINTALSAYTSDEFVVYTAPQVAPHFPNIYMQHGPEQQNRLSTGVFAELHSYTIQANAKSNDAATLESMTAVFIDAIRTLCLRGINLQITVGTTVLTVWDLQMPLSINYTERMGKGVRTGSMTATFKIDIPTALYDP